MSVDEYISRYPKEVQPILKNIREEIRKTAKDAEETISYGIPTYKLNKTNLVHFGAFKDHVGFFPTSSGVEYFKEELKNYKTSKGTVQFPLDKKIPYALIKKIVKFRIKEVKNRV